MPAITLGTVLGQGGAVVPNDGKLRPGAGVINLAAGVPTIPKTITVPAPSATTFAASAPTIAGTGPTDVAATDPASLSPILWLKADALALSDGAAVTTWTDSSGNGRDATQATAGKQPTYKTNIWNGNPTVRFDGGDGLGTAAVDLTAQQAVTVYAVASATDQASQMIVEFSDNLNNESTNAAFYMGVNSDSALMTNLKGNANYSECYTLNTFEAGTGVPMVAHGVYDMGLFVNETQGGLNGDTTHKRGTNFGDNTGFFGNHPFNIGCRDADASAGASAVFLTGDIAEIIVYTGRHTAAQRWGIERWLAEKYNVTAWSKPVANIVFEGDSITIGGNNYYGNNYPRRLVNRLKDKVAWIDTGVNGQRIDNIVSDYTTQVRPESAWANFGTKNVQMFFSGTNDMVSVGGNQTGAATATEYLAHADTLRADGFEVVAFTALPRSDTPVAPADFNSTQRPAFNSAIVAATSRYDALANVGADSTIGDAGDELNTTYYDADKVHPNVTGQRYLSGLVGATLSASFGVNEIVPTDLSGLALWYDANQITGKVDGDAISQWNDLSGNGKHATQATGTKQPIYKTNIFGGKPVVRFQGTDDFMDIPAIDLSGTAAITLFMVLTCTVAGTSQVVLEMSNNYNSFTDSFIFVRQADNTVQIATKGAATSSAETSLAVTTTACVVTGVLDRGKSTREATVFRNGVIGGRSNNNNTTGNFGNRVLYLGSRGGVSNFFTGDIAELMIYSRALTGGERGRLEEYAAYKYGLF